MKYFIAFTLLALTACGGSEPSGTTKAEEARSAAKIYGLKEAAPADGVEITLTSVKQTNQALPPEASPPAGPDETFVVLQYQIKNTGDEPIDLFSRPDLELLDGDGQSYAKDDLATTVLTTTNDPSGAANAMNPGTTVKATAVWKVAKAGFDLASWKVIARTDPQLEFKLK